MSGSKFLQFSQGNLIASATGEQAGATAAGRAPMKVLVTTFPRIQYKPNHAVGGNTTLSEGYRHPAGHRFWVVTSPL